jgi:hypothetical protein
MHTDMMGQFQHMTLKSEGPGDMFGQCCRVSLGLKGKIVMKINKKFLSTVINFNCPNFAAIFVRKLATLE